MHYYQMAAALGGVGGRIGSESSGLGELLLLTGVLVFSLGVALLLRAPSVEPARVRKNPRP